MTTETQTMENIAEDLIRGRYYEELQVGDAFTGIVVTVTESMIVSACGLFQDIAPLHRDREAAAAAGFKSLIAPGTLTSGLMIAPLALVVGRASVTHLTDSVTFKAPVYAGDTLTIEIKIIRMERRSRFGIVEYEIDATNQQGQAVAQVHTLMGHRYADTEGIR